MALPIPLRVVWRKIPCHRGHHNSIFELQTIHVVFRKKGIFWVVHMDYLW